MKNFKKTLALALATAVSVSTVFVAGPAEAKAASKSKYSEPVTLSTKSVKAATVKYAKGQSFTLDVTKGKKAVKASKLTFTTNKKSVATVSKKGVVTIKAKSGTATITVKEKANSKNKVTLKVSAASSIPATDVTATGLKKNKLSLAVKGKVTFAVAPVNTTDTVKWSSQDKKIAKVDKKTGEVTGVKAGTAKIYAKVGTKTIKTITVTVNDLKLKTTKKSVAVNKKFTLKVKEALPKGAKVKWETSDKKIATISSTKGNSIKVTGKKAGTVTIKATYGAATATCKVTVNALTLKTTSKKIDVNENFKLSVKTASPKGGTVKWKTSDNKIATISSTKGNTITVTGKKAGTATITATYGAATATCKVTVNKAKATTVAVKELTLTPAATTWNATKIGATTKVKATVNSDATDKTVKWTSSNTNVVTVSKASVTSGTEITLTAKGLGTATVTATAGSKTATIKVTVTENALTTTDTTYTYNLTKKYTVKLDNKTAAFGVAQDELAADVATLKEDTNKTWTAEGLKNLLSGIASKGSKSAWLKVISLTDSKYSTIGSLLKTDIAFDGTDKLTAGKIEFRAIALQAESETAHTVSYDLYENGTKVGSRVVTIAKDAKSITIKEGNALLFSFTETSTGHTFVIDKTAYSRLVTDGVIDDYVANATVTNTAK